jgi:hypothetical protein
MLIYGISSWETDGTEQGRSQKMGRKRNAGSDNLISSGLESRFFFFPSRKRVNDHASELVIYVKDGQDHHP